MSLVATRPIELANDSSLIDESLFEVIEGQRREKPLMGTLEAYLGTLLASHLTVFARQNGLGRVASEMLFKLNTAGNPMRRPDVAFVSFGRWPRDRKINSDNGWDVVPDLAVEVNSLNKTASEVLKKVRDYFRTGVLQVWVVFPEVRQLYVYESATKVQILAEADSLGGGDLLPGFRLALLELFEDGVEV